MSYNEIIKDLKNHEIGKVYFFYGEEVLLMEETIYQLKESIVASGLEELNYTIFEGKDLSIEDLMVACETLPFMSEKKLVIVKHPEIFEGRKKELSSEDEEKLLSYFEKIPETTCLVFQGPSTIDMRKKIIKAIQKYGKIISFDKLKEDELNKWVLKKLNKYGKEINAKELMFFISNVDYFGNHAKQNLLDIDNEIRKIVAYMGSDPIVTQSHIERVVTHTLENDIFKLLNAIEKKNCKEALLRLNYMLTEGEAVMRIFYTLGNQIRNVLATKLLLEEGYTSKMVASKLGIHPYVASKCALQSKGFTVERLKKLLNISLEMDIGVKTGKIDDQIALELLIVEMCK